MSAIRFIKPIDSCDRQEVQSWRKTTLQRIMKILVVEDDRTIAHTLRLLLGRYGYAVDIAKDGEAGLQMAEAFEYDLFMLDVRLPGMDGISLCQQLRAQGCQKPILLLTGEGGGQQKAIALNAGADDYVVKPFNAEELIARIQALLRRGGVIGQPILTWGPLAIDPSCRQVTYGTQLLSLTPKEYAILELFLRNPQRPLNARAILDQVWSSVESPGEEAIRVHIKELRQKLKAVDAPQDLIKTVHRVGYRLNPVYGSLRLTQSEQQLSAPQLAELKAVTEEQRVILESLRSTQVELRQKNQELELACQTLAQEQQRLEATRTELALRVAERTAELMKSDHDRQQQHHQWQALFDHALDAIVISDDNGRYLEANPAACELFGVSREELLRSSVAKFADPALEAESLWQQFLQQEQMAGEFRLYRPDGTTRETEFAAIAHFMPGRHLSILRDISARKRSEAERNQAEAKLQESERKLRAIFDSALQFMGLLTVDGRVVDANRAALDAVAAKLPDVIGKPFWETPWWQHCPKQQHQLRQAIARAACGEFVRFETTHIGAKGTVSVIDFSIKPIVDAAGNVVMLLPEGWDITDRLQAEQKIREQAALLDIASDAIVVRDLDQRILYWNQGARRLYGWQVEEAIGQNASALLHEEPGQIATILKTLFEQGEWQGESCTVTQTGQEVITAGRWTLVRDDAGHPKYMLTVNTDITEKKRLEAQFYQAQRLESLGTLAGGIAHDLNNVLTPILAISQLLRLQYLHLDERVYELLGVLESSAERGAKMVKQILTFSRGTDGERITLQVGPLLEEVISVAQQTFPKSIAIQPSIPEHPLWPISADPTHLHQVFMNLCVNARDAMPHGGVLTLSAENYVVDEAVAQANLEAQVGNYVVITVADTGTGMPPNVRDRLFEPFFTTKALGQGTGLGLATVRGIVKNMGGFLQVFSAPERGSQFKVYLPATRETATETHPSLAWLQGMGELILIVDDDPTIQQTNRWLLESHHYTTLLAKDGLEAIELYTHHQDEISVVLLDIMMPKMDGITVIQTLKRMNPHVKIFAISGVLSHREGALAAGANVFLPKPYTPEKLLKRLHNLINP